MSRTRRTSLMSTTTVTATTTTRRTLMACARILDDYARKDSRIKVAFQKNQGVSAARNTALSMAKGKYICFLDSDDALAPTFLEKMYKAIIDSHVGIVWCDHHQGKEKRKWNQSDLSYRLYGDIFDRFLKESPFKTGCVIPPGIKYVFVRLSTSTTMFLLFAIFYREKINRRAS